MLRSGSKMGHDHASSFALGGKKPRPHYARVAKPKIKAEQLRVER
jgi:hypothetical protein